MLLKAFPPNAAEDLKLVEKKRVVQRLSMVHPDSRSLSPGLVPLCSSVFLTHMHTLCSTL